VVAFGLVPSDAERTAGDDAPGPPGAFTDPTLIDEMLALTPEERLRQNDRLVRTIQELRDGFAAAAESIEIQVEGQRVRVLRLETLADLKRGSTSAKDRLTLAIIEDTLRRLSGR